MAKILLVDTFNLIRRLYEANPAGGSAIDEVIEASRRAFDKALRQHQPSHVIAVVDSHEETWRHRLYTGYKLGRPPTPAALLDHLQRLKAAFAGLGAQSLKARHNEDNNIKYTIIHTVFGGK